MNSSNELENMHGFAEEIDAVNGGADDSLSIDDFIKELEAKEKDLQISSDLAIEIEESDFDDSNPPDFIKAELASQGVKMLDLPSVPNEQANGQTIARLESEISMLKLQMSKTESERREIAETMRRRQVDFDNYRKRIERDRGDTFLNQISNLVKQMLPVLDNLDRALDFAITHGEGRSQDFHQFYEGIVMVNQQLNEVLAEMGVSPVASVGQMFDPHFHEAVAIEPSAELPPNTITAELLRGYRVGNRVIRAAMVKVSTPAVPEKEPEKESGETRPESFGDPVAESGLMNESAAAGETPEAAPGNELPKSE